MKADVTTDRKLSSKIFDKLCNRAEKYWRERSSIIFKSNIRWYDSGFVDLFIIEIDYASRRDEKRKGKSIEIHSRVATVDSRRTSKLISAEFNMELHR